MVSVVFLHIGHVGSSSVGGQNSSMPLSLIVFGLLREREFGR
jgi:hypothetical protein